MKLTIKSVHGKPACSNYFVDEHTKIEPGQYIEIDGRGGYDRSLLEQVSDEEAAEMEKVEGGNAAPSVDVASQGHEAQLKKQAEEEKAKADAKDAEIEALKAQLAEAQKGK